MVVLALIGVAGLALLVRARHRLDDVDRGHVPWLSAHVAMEAWPSGSRKTFMGVPFASYSSRTCGVARANEAGAQCRPCRPAPSAELPDIRPRERAAFGRLRGPSCRRGARTGARYRFCAWSWQPRRALRSLSERTTSASGHVLVGGFRFSRKAAVSRRRRGHLLTSDAVAGGAGSA